MTDSRQVHRITAFFRLSEPPLSALDFDRLDTIARESRPTYSAADPFPHIAIDDFLPADIAERVFEEFATTSAGWDSYHHYNEKKEAVTSLAPMGPHTRALFGELQSSRFVDFVQTLTGLENLVSDPHLDGAGMHKVMPGGFLNVHTDFLCHPTEKNWRREVNLLLYFNKDWQTAWNGDLEFWDVDMTRCVQSIPPLFNRCVVFQTTERSYHGHPQRLACPEGVYRKSLALYYFRVEGAPIELSSTHYRPLPADPPHKKLLVAADRMLLRAYSFVRRHTRLSDGVVARILKRF